MKPDEIRALRKSYQWTQETLSRLLGVGTITVSKWERGEALPSPYAVELMNAWARAASPDLGARVHDHLVAGGVVPALTHLFNAAAFYSMEATSPATVLHSMEG